MLKKFQYLCLKFYNLFKCLFLINFHLKATYKKYDSHFEHNELSRHEINTILKLTKVSKIYLIPNC